MIFWLPKLVGVIFFFGGGGGGEGAGQMRKPLMKLDFKYFAYPDGFMISLTPKMGQVHL